MQDYRLITQPQDDEIVLSLVEQKMVLHDTVRIGVQVNAQRAPETDEDAMRASIKAVLRKFIDTDWRFLSVQRSRGVTRFEIVVVQAIARVPESQNKQLFERASEVSVAGLELINPIATYVLPFDQVQKINADLRVELFSQAEEECARYGGEFRVASVEFADTPSYQAVAQNVTRAGATYGNQVHAYAVSAPGGGDDAVADEGSPDLGVTERFWVSAQVTLARKQPT